MNTKKYYFMFILFYDLMCKRGIVFFFLITPSSARIYDSSLNWYNLQQFVDEIVKLWFVQKKF